MEPSAVIFGVQLTLAVFAAIAYTLRSLHQDRNGKMAAERVFQIIAAVVSALILPFGGVIVYSAYDPSALDWLKEGNFRMSFFAIGVGAIVYALINLKNNWPR